VGHARDKFFRCTWHETLSITDIEITSVQTRKTAVWVVTCLFRVEIINRTLHLFRYLINFMIN